ncbi:MAG TPA: DUF4410 domain-containing protein [Candidatus Saccharimonadales bacterium]|nr:DUF4410 domain-containing protein [Candidatus Saccharimonadales bacterium]
MKQYFALITESALMRFKTECLVAALAALGVAMIAGCSSAKVTGTQNFAAVPAGKPAVVYVANFELQAENIQKSGSLLTPMGRSGPVRDLLLGQSGDPQALAEKLVNLMAGSIVKELTKAGVTAIRLEPGAPLPVTGWLVRGVFTEVQQGNRLRRAIVGLGFGKTDLQVMTATDDLSSGAPKPFYQIETDANSGKLPGAAATIVLSPYSVPVRFVLTRGDLKKNVKKTAVKIADEVVQRIQAVK